MIVLESIIPQDNKVRGFITAVSGLMHKLGETKSVKVPGRLYLEDHRPYSGEY